MNHLASDANPHCARVHERVVGLEEVALREAAAAVAKAAAEASEAALVVSAAAAAVAASSGGVRGASPYKPVAGAGGTPTSRVLGGGGDDGEGEGLGLASGEEWEQAFGDPASPMDEDEPHTPKSSSVNDSDDGGGGCGLEPGLAAALARLRLARRPNAEEALEAFLEVDAGLEQGAGGDSDDGGGGGAAGGGGSGGAAGGEEDEEARAVDKDDAAREKAYKAEYGEWFKFISSSYDGKREELVQSLLGLSKDEWKLVKICRVRGGLI